MDAMLLLLLQHVTSVHSLSHICQVILSAAIATSFLRSSLTYRCSSQGMVAGRVVSMQTPVEILTLVDSDLRAG
jgi:hypothetical protein